MITFQQVSKRYSNNHLALDDVTLHMAPGEFTFLTGHSGAGKSTLLKLIAAIEQPSDGQIIVANQRLTQLPRRRIPYLRRNMGIILQNPKLLSDRTVFENVALPLIVEGLSYHEAHSRVRAVLAKVGLQRKEMCLPQELSSGEQQRVAIARAIVGKPSLLIADEPTGNLDPALSAEIMHLFEQFNRLGMTVLIASHDVALINRLKRRVITLSEGKICTDL